MAEDAKQGQGKNAPIDEAMTAQDKQLAALSQRLGELEQAVVGLHTKVQRRFAKVKDKLKRAHDLAYSIAGMVPPNEAPDPDETEED